MENKIDLRECEEGDVLISSLGEILYYIRPTNEGEYLNHVVAYSSPGLGYGTSTHDGYTFAKNRKPETDHDIIKIVKRKGLSEFEFFVKTLQAFQEPMSKLKEARLTWKGQSDEWIYERLQNELSDKVETIHSLIEENNKMLEYIDDLKKECFRKEQDFNSMINSAIECLTKN